eukprot:scaffold94889_cov65-Phaeocystis_antarctica.AAC.2
MPGGSAVKKDGEIGWNLTRAEVCDVEASRVGGGCDTGWVVDRLRYYAPHLSLDWSDDRWLGH